MSEQRERPLLCSASVVRAILRGDQTQDRRPISLLNSHFGSAPREYWQHADFGEAWVDGKDAGSEYLHVPCHASGIVQCPTCRARCWSGTTHRLWPNIAPAGAWVQEREHGYTPPASRLWVRETWQALNGGSWDEQRPAIKGRCELRYAASAPLATCKVADRGYRWRPSIHMPRWASRITLEVTEVRVQRVQDISEEDATAEGVGQWAMETNAVLTCATMREAFSKLWDSLYAKRGLAWSVNPWVWAISFRRVKP